MLGAGFGELGGLDFGRGIGNLDDAPREVVPDADGFDPSAECVKLGGRALRGAKLHSETSAIPTGHFGAAILANVLHHVPPAERTALMGTGRLRPLAPGRPAPPLRQPCRTR